MKLPVDFFVQSIGQRKVYYFSSSQLNTAIPHYFVCVMIVDTSTVVLVCCTSDKEDKRRKRIEKLNLHSTLVWIKPDTENGLTKDTYVDCNTYFEYTIEEFTTLYENNLLEYKGIISETHYGQIILGLLDSPTIAIETKELLRNISN